MSVSISIKSKKFECSFSLEHKLSVIVGDSGRGKSQLVERVSSNSGAVKVEVSEGYEPFVLTEPVFKQFLNKAKRAVELGRYKNLKEYWGDDNFPLENCIIFIDDEDFVIRREFDLFFNADISNYYIIINRTKLSGVNYSVSDVFEFCTEGRRHWLKRKYDLSMADSIKPSIVITEGIGSDYIFISELYKNSLISLLNLGQTGKDATYSFLRANADKFRGKRILLLIDYCAFGSCFEPVLNLCSEEGIDVVISSDYLSFEYLLLNTTLIKREFDEKR